MSKLLPVMKEFGKDYLQEIANEQPDLVDLLILTVHLPSHKKKFILKQLNNDIKKFFLIQ